MRVIRVYFSLLLCLWAINYSLVFPHYIFAQQEEGALIKTELRYTASELRDPFEDNLRKYEAQETAKEAGAEEAAKTLPTFSVQGIIWGSSLPQAIIDDAVVKVGDTIKEAKVIAIDKEGITLLYYGREYKISSPSATPQEAQEQGGIK
jgi:hypothetical protein